MKKLFTIFALSAIVLGMASCGEDPEKDKAPEGAINGKFTIGNGTQVYFSKGNLQAIFSEGGQWVWEFAENQWDLIGDKAGNTTIDVYGTLPAHDTVDLFGWSSDLVNNNYGISKSIEATFYSGEFEDWGKAFGEGWYTMSIYEWDYLFFKRNDAAHLFGMGSIGGVNGVILLPDDWTGQRFFDTDRGLTAEGTHYYHPEGTNFEFHSYSKEQWIPLQEKGAVFLPAAGERIGTEVMSLNSYGNYWSPVLFNDGIAYCLSFDGTELNPQRTHDRYYGLSVRLVKKVE